MSNVGKESKESKEMIVVAAAGVSAILNIDGKTLIIDAHTPVNLSRLFPAETLKKCYSLYAHFRQGNLVLYKNQPLSQAPEAAFINALNVGPAENMEISYTQETSSTGPGAITTKVVVAEEVKQQIREKVEENKIQKEAFDNRLVAKMRKQTTNADAGTRSMGKIDKAMTPEQLHMNMTANTSPEIFEEMKQLSIKERQDRLATLATGEVPIVDDFEDLNLVEPFDDDDYDDEE